MANHAYVKTRKTMKPEVISEIIEELNQRLFKGNLKVEYTPKNPNDKDFWEMEYISPTDDKTYAYRSCWLNSGRSFEMRHGGGGNFAWWIDNAICNEIALRYDGTISDDGVEEKWKGKVGDYDKLEEFLKRMNSWVSQGSGEAIIEILKWELYLIPPEFKGSQGELLQ